MTQALPPHAKRRTAMHKSAPDPKERLYALLVEDRRDLIVLLTYTLVIGLLSLAVPLTAQALVNTIAAGVFLQPLIVLSLLLLAVLLLTGFVRVLKLLLVETLQERIFARLALRITERLPRLHTTSLKDEYVPELVNRFFEVMTIQKSWAKLLLEGPSAIGQIAVGLILLTVYSPWLLAFSLACLIVIWFCLAILGTGGVKTGIRESIEKYKVAEWLEELGRCHIGLKLSAMSNFVVEKSDALVVSFIKARRQHFAVLLRQAVASYFFQAIAGTGILAIGGWLVINRQLTLGQLVAAELVALSIVTAMDKLVRNCESFFDLLVGLDKIGYVVDMPVERLGGIDLSSSTAGATLICSDIYFSYSSEKPVLQGLSFQLNPGERCALVGASGAGQSTLAYLIAGLLEPTSGCIEIDGIDIKDANLPSLRSVVELVSDRNEIIEGTILENITLGRPLGYHAVKEAATFVQLSGDLNTMPAGLNTHLISGGQNLARGQLQKVLLARAIVGRPRLLILDEAFVGIEEKTKLKIIDVLYSPEQPWTIIDISHDAEIVLRSQTVYLIHEGQIAESGKPTDLSWDRQSLFAELFPELSRQLLVFDRRKERRASLQEVKND